jgi:hypothetical protein
MFVCESSDTDDNEDAEVLSQTCIYWSDYVWMLRASICWAAWPINKFRTNQEVPRERCEGNQSTCRLRANGIVVCYRAFKALLRSLFKVWIAALMLSEQTVLNRGLNALRRDGPTECNESRGSDSTPCPNPHLFSPPTCVPTPVVSVLFKKLSQFFF